MAYAALIIICILLKTKLTDRNVNVFFCVGHFRNGVNCLPPANSNLLNEGFCSSVKETFQNWVRGCVVLSEWWGQPLQLQGKRVKWRCWVQWGHGQAVSLGFLPSVLLLSNPDWEKGWSWLPAQQALSFTQDLSWGQKRLTVCSDKTCGVKPYPLLVSGSLDFNDYQDKLLVLRRKWKQIVANVSIPN